MRNLRPQPDLLDTAHPQPPAAGGAALNGLRVVPGYLDRPAQEVLLAALRRIIRLAPLYTARMPKSGRPMSVRMSNCGPLGLVHRRARLPL